MKKNTESTIIMLPRKLLETVSTDKTRMVINSALIDAEKRCIVTTNGRVGCITPIAGETPIKPGFITREMWEIAKARNKRAMEYDYAAGTINGEPIISPEAHYDMHGVYPNYQQIIPNDPVVYRMILDPKYIQSIADTFGLEGGMTFELPQDGITPIMIRCGEKYAVLSVMRGESDTGLLVSAGGENTDALKKEIAAARAKITELSERSDNNLPDAEADVKVIDALRSELFQTRARVKELEAVITMGTTGKATPPDPKVKPLDAKGKAKPEIPVASAPPILSRNEERNGIELRFNGKPDPATHGQLLARKWKWAPGQPGKPWYCKYSEEQWVFAHSLAEGTTASSMPEDAADNITQMPSPPTGESRVRKIELPDF